MNIGHIGLKHLIHMKVSLICRGLIGKSGPQRPSGGSICGYVRAGRGVGSLTLYNLKFCKALQL